VFSQLFTEESYRLTDLKEGTGRPPDAMAAEV
jgi:hypothetical protein